MDSDEATITNESHAACGTAFSDQRNSSAMESDSNPDVHAPLISSFCKITSASRQEALFFLESHNFDLDAAVSSFLDDDNAHHNIIGATNIGAGDNALPSPADFQHSPSPMPSQPPIDPLSRTTAQGMAPEIPSGGGAGGIRTFSDLKLLAPDSLSYNSDEPQGHNSGGDPKSVDGIFNQARPLAVDGPLQNTATSKSFTGTARSLSGATVSSNPQQAEIITHKITFWRNGFSVDDCPLRRLDDPQNASFLESIKKSECPRELEPANLKATVLVSLTRRDDNYPKSSRRSRNPFCGIGRTIGGQSSSSDAPAGPNQTTVDSAYANAAPTPSMGLVVDNLQPVTSIQLRLADGTRTVSRFNCHHTIRDVRAFIDASRPSGAGAYQLLTMGFPPKQLTDLNHTIDQAGIANSVVIQKV